MFCDGASRKGVSKLFQRNVSILYSPFDSGVHFIEVCKDSAASIILATKISLEAEFPDFGYVCRL